MTIAFLCILIASVLPIAWAGIAKYTHGFSMKDNSNPREILEKSTGSAKRANWAQQNSWEAFGPFAAAVIIASIAGVNQNSIDTLAMTFVAARVLYGLFYITDKATLRSLVWTVGMVCNFTLYYLVWCTN